MTGVILLMTVALRSTAGAKLLLEKAQGEQAKFFETDQDIVNWIDMLEKHLMFEKWLRKDPQSPGRAKRRKKRVSTPNFS